MVAPVTPEEWLTVLANRLDDRRTRITTLRSYVTGNAPLPEMGRNVKAAWERFQAKSRSNYGELVVESTAERLVCQGVRIGTVDQDDDRARTVWKRNRMDVVTGDAIRDFLTCGVGYLAVGVGVDGLAVVTSEPPEFMIAATDPLQPWVSRAALKIWRDVDMEQDYAYLWFDGVRVKFERSIFDDVENGSRTPRVRTTATGGWNLAENAVEEYSGAVPVFVLENHAARGEFESHTDLIDRINLGILQRLVTIAMQAFRQRAVKGHLPDVDEANNKIDYAAIFTPAPGALWELPDGVDIWESQESAQSIQQMLAAVKDDVKDLAAVTRTPVAVLVPDAANQSAEGAAFAREGLVFKAKDRLARLKPSIDAALERALRAEDAEFTDVVDTMWFPVEHVSLTERYAAAVQAQAAGVPWRTVMTDILGFPGEQVDRMEGERAQEQLTVGALFEAGQSANA